MTVVKQFKSEGGGLGIFGVAKTNTIGEFSYDDLHNRKFLKLFRLFNQPLGPIKIGIQNLSFSVSSVDYKKSRPYILFVETFNCSSIRIRNSVTKAVRSCVRRS